MASALEASVISTIELETVGSESMTKPLLGIILVGVSGIQFEPLAGASVLRLEARRISQQSITHDVRLSEGRPLGIGLPRDCATRILGLQGLRLSDPTYAN